MSVAMSVTMFVTDKNKRQSQCNVSHNVTKTNDTVNCANVFFLDRTRHAPQPGTMVFDSGAPLLNTLIFVLTESDRDPRSDRDPTWCSDF